jgi:hypothetical protein
VLPAWVVKVKLGCASFVTVTAGWSTAGAAGATVSRM